MVARRRLNNFEFITHYHLKVLLLFCLINVQWTLPCFNFDVVVLIVSLKRVLGVCILLLGIGHCFLQYSSFFFFKKSCLTLRFSPVSRVRLQTYKLTYTLHPDPKHQFVEPTKCSFVRKTLHSTRLPSHRINHAVKNNVEIKKIISM